MVVLHRRQRLEKRGGAAGRVAIQPGVETGSVSRQKSPGLPSAKLPNFGLEPQDLGRGSENAGCTTRLDLAGRVLEVRLLTGMSGVDRHGPIGVMCANFDDRSVKLDRNGQ